MRTRFIRIDYLPNPMNPLSKKEDVQSVFVNVEHIRSFEKSPFESVKLVKSIITVGLCAPIADYYSTFSVADILDAIESVMKL